MSTSAMRFRLSTVSANCMFVVVVLLLLKDSGAAEFQLQPSRCRRVVKQHTRLAEGGLQESSRVIRNEYPVRTAAQCYAHCCNFIADDGSRCNAAIYNADANDPLELFIGGTCMLLNCGPTFKGCLWQSGPFIQSSVAHIIHKRTTLTNVTNSLTTTTASSLMAADMMSAPTPTTAPQHVTTSGDQTAVATTTESTDAKQLMFPTLPTAPFFVNENVTTTASPQENVSTTTTTTTTTTTDSNNYNIFFDDGFDDEQLDEKELIAAAAAADTTPENSPTTTTAGPKKLDDLWNLREAIDELQRQQPTISKGSRVTEAPVEITITEAGLDVDRFFQPNQLPTTSMSAPVNAAAVLADNVAAEKFQTSATQSTLLPDELKRHYDVNVSHTDAVALSDFTDFQTTSKPEIIDIEGDLKNSWDRSDDRVKIAAIFVPDKDDAPADDFQSPVIVLAIVSTMTLIGLAIGLLLVICRRLMGVSKPRYMPLREDPFGTDSGRPEFPTNYLVTSSRQSARLLPK